VSTDAITTTAWTRTRALVAPAPVSAVGNSILVPNSAVRVRMGLVPTTGAVSAADAGRGTHADAKQGSPPRGAPR